MSDPTASRLPPEIVDVIIDQLHEDTPSLKTCALVCRAWLPSCRYHLFYEVELNLHGNRRRIVGFLEALEPVASSLPFYVRSLRLDGAPRDEGVLPRLAALRALESLSISSMIGAHQWRLLRPADKATWLFSLHTVARLEISQCSVAFPHFIGFIRAFTSLEKLSLDAVSWYKAKDVQPGLIKESLLPRLRTLRLGHLHGSITPALASLFLQKTLPAVECLHVQDVEQEHASSVGRLISIPGPSLKHLEISSKNLDQDVIRSSIALAHNANLRAIHINGLFDPCHHASFSLTWVYELLSQITSIHMQAIIFEIYLLPNDRLDVVDWVRLDQIFGQPQFENLQEVGFHLHLTTRGLAWLKNMIRRRLPTSETRGIVHFR